MRESTPIFYLAPMVGVSDASFRLAFMRHFGGVTHAISPFLKTLQGGDCKDSKLDDLQPDRQASLELYPQLLSNQVDDFVAIALRLFDMGYHKINLNLGCPVPMAAGRGRGAGLLPHPEYIDRMLDGILEKIPNQLSIKTRLGYESDVDLDVLCPIFNRYPLFAIAIHPRTAKQGYSGIPDLVRFQHVSTRLTSPIIYSGDIVSVDDYLRLSTQFPAIEHWMIGRGLLGNPWLPQTLQAHTRAQLLPPAEGPSWRLMADFYEDMSQELRRRRWEDNSILMRLKTLAYYRGEAVALEKKAIKALRKSSRCDEFFSLLRSL